MNKNILVVDDEADIVKTVAMALELDGYKVTTAMSGTEAMEEIRVHRPDLVIIDMVLPGISGKDIAHWIKNSEGYKDIPIILITALAQQNERESFKKEEIDHCLIKPFALDQLEAKVKELLDEPLAERPAII